MAGWEGVAQTDSAARYTVQRTGDMIQRTIVVPVKDNEGCSLTAEITCIEAELLKLIGGYSVASSAGVWRSDDYTTYRDHSMTFTVVADEATDALLLERLPGWAERLRQVMLFTYKTVVEVGLVVTADGTTA